MDDRVQIAKCVILARGLGTRMRRGDSSAALDASQSAVADAGMKAMIPVGRPFLDYVLSGLADAGFEQVCLVIGPEHEAVREYYTNTVKPQRLEVSFAIQQEALGTANALLAAEQFAGDDQFLAMNSDNYYPAEALDSIRQLGQAGTVLFPSGTLVRHSNIPEERVREFAYCVVDQDGFLADITEKPDAAAAANFGTEKLVSMNFWRFGPDIFDACHEVPRSLRGEYELSQAVKLAIQNGMKLKVAVRHAGVFDLSSRTDIAEVTARLQGVEVRL